MMTTKKIFYIIFILFSVCMLSGCSKQIVLSHNQIVLEYGEDINKDIETYLNIDKCSTEIIKSATLNISSLIYKHNHYPEVGEYQIYIESNEQKIPVNVIVKDTVCPQINIKKSIIVNKGLKFKGNISDYCEVTDFSHYKVLFDDDQVNYQKVGDYKGKITVIDDVDNQTEKLIDIKVIESIKDIDYVKVKDYISNIYIDLRYATNNNFVGQTIYSFKEPYLRYGTVKKLIKVQNELNSKGYCLKIWDAYRPYSAQKKLWSIVNNPRYVADPSKGPRAHNLGGTVDITLVKINGDSIDMPTDFDDFSLKADRNYEDISDQEAIENSRLLEQVMTKYGFKGYENEWWHYTDTNKYSFVDFIPQ